MLIPAGYVTTVYDPVFRLSDDRMRYVPAASDAPTPVPAPGLPFSLVFRAEPGREDLVLRIASAYEAASKRPDTAARLRAAAVNSLPAGNFCDPPLLRADFGFAGNDLSGDCVGAEQGTGERASRESNGPEQGSRRDL